MRAFLKHTRLALSLATLLYIPIGLAGEQCADTPVFQTTSSFADLETATQKFAKFSDSSKVLMVFDIDNTLLAMDQDLGSDQWFEWQEGLLRNQPHDPALVASDFQGLLDAQTLLWNIGEMSPPEKEQPAIIHRMQKRGFTSLLLTSRGPEVNDLTLKALENNGYHFSTTSLPPKEGFPATFLPYNRSKIEYSGITINEAIAMELGFDSKQDCLKKKLEFSAPCFRKPRPVKYADGIFFTTGQNKGAMLRTLLYKTGHTGSQRFSAIVYADDKIKHVKHVYQAFCDKPVELLLFHYTHESKRVELFRKDSKSKLSSKWKQIQKIRKLMHQ
jgi:Protein of unknown function (DUF2608)